MFLNKTTGAIQLLRNAIFGQFLPLPLITKCQTGPDSPPRNLTLVCRFVMLKSVLLRIITSNIQMINVFMSHFSLIYSSLT